MGSSDPLKEKPSEIIERMSRALSDLKQTSEDWHREAVRLKAKWLEADRWYAAASNWYIELVSHVGPAHQRYIAMHARLNGVIDTFTEFKRKEFTAVTWIALAALAVAMVQNFILLYIVLSLRQLIH